MRRDLYRYLFAALSGLAVFFGVSTVAVSDEKPTVIIGYSEDWPPYSERFHGIVDGVLPRIMGQIIEGEMGYKVRHVASPWAKVQADLREGVVDAMITTPTPKRLAYSTRSRNDVMIIPYRPFAFKGSDYMAVPGDGSWIFGSDDVKHCDMLGNGWGEVFYEDKTVIKMIAPELAHCLRMLFHGRVDVVINAEPAVRTELRKLGLEDEIVPVIDALPESPGFPLLLSKKTKLPEGFLAEFDAAIDRLKKNGALARMIKEEFARSEAMEQIQ